MSALQLVLGWAVAAWAVGVVLVMALAMILLAKNWLIHRLRAGPR